MEASDKETMHQQQVRQPIAEFLTVIQRELGERSMAEGKLIFLGELSGDTPAEHWTGSISLRDRIESGDLTKAEVDEAASHLNEDFVPVTKGASKRCVDGSTIAGYDDTNPDSYGRPLGVQEQGGTAGAATGKRLSFGYEEGATLVSDIENEAMSGSSEYAPGDHTDDHADGSKTGCGHVDGHEGKTKLLGSDRIATVTKKLSDVYGAAQLDYPDSKEARLKKSGEELTEHANDYYMGVQSALDVLKKYNANAIETLIRPHGEVSVTINLVKGTTFHRDHYNARTNSKIQNFNLDAWNIIEEQGEDAFYELADAIATLMTLTDGSIMVFLRVPNEEQVPAQV